MCVCVSRYRDAITALAFREGSHTLLSGSLDRTVKLWSIDDRAYVDTLFGHQQEVRRVTCIYTRTCWVVLRCMLGLHACMGVA